MEKDIVETIKRLAYTYLRFHENNRVFGRGSSESCQYAKGMFEGYLMAHNLTYELTFNVIVVYNEKDEIVCTIDVYD